MNRRCNSYICLRRHFLSAKFCFPLLLMASWISAQGATITWVTTSGGNWNDTNNWSPNQVPGIADTALITAIGTYTVTLDATNAQVAVLTLGGASGNQSLT